MTSEGSEGKRCRCCSHHPGIGGYCVRSAQQDCANSHLLDETAELRAELDRFQQAHVAELGVSLNRITELERPLWREAQNEPEWQQRLRALADEDVDRALRELTDLRRNAVLRGARNYALKDQVNELARERDEARAEADRLRDELQQSERGAMPEDLATVIAERDAAREVCLRLLNEGLVPTSEHPWLVAAAEAGQVPAAVAVMLLAGDGDDEGERAS